MFIGISLQRMAMQEMEDLMSSAWTDMVVQPGHTVFISDYPSQAVKYKIFSRQLVRCLLCWQAKFVMTDEIKKSDWLQQHCSIHACRPSC